MQLVMEAVRPLGVVGPALERPAVADLRLGDDEHARALRVDALGELREDMPWGVVVDGEDGVEPEPVDPIVPNPRAGVLDRPLTHGGLRVIERVAPGSLEAIGEPRAEGGERRAGTDVVIDDIEDHGELLAMRRVDEAGEALWSS